MGIEYKNLDEKVREFMLRELDQDIASGTLYFSPRLTDLGVNTWPELLRESILRQNDDWLASELGKSGIIATHEQRRTRSGGYTTVRVPYNASETMAEGEFNRFYIRGLCAEVLESGGEEVEIYRGKSVSSPRPESRAIIGRRFPAQKLLEDLRTSQGVEPAFGLPPGPNSGLTVRRVET